MKIAFDGKRYFKNRSGLGRYSRSLVRGILAHAYDEDIFLTLFKPKGFSAFENPNHERAQIRQAEHMLPGDLGDGLWRFMKLPDLVNIAAYDLYHGPSHVVPSKLKCPSVVTMFDLIFLRFPQYFPLWDRNYYRYVFKKSALLADFIIAISQSTKNDLINLFGINEDKISVIYPAFDDVIEPLSQESLETIKKHYFLPEKFVLSVGTLEPRKNFHGTAAAFSLLHEQGKIDKNVELVIVGSKGWFYKKILKKVNSLPGSDKIRFTGHIPDEHLTGLYQLASVMAYPSLFEGFGYPVVEAMRLGTPVVTSSSSSLLEVGGDAAILVDPDDTEELAHAMEKVLNDEKVGTTMREKGLVHSEKFSLDTMITQTINIYKRCSSSHSAED